MYTLKRRRGLGLPFYLVLAATLHHFANKVVCRGTMDLHADTRTGYAYFSLEQYSAMVSLCNRKIPVGAVTLILA